MAAGLGFKTFNTGDVLTASEVNGYLMQGILVFADATARDAAITSPEEGQFAYTKDNNSLWYYSGSAWVASGATGDIEGVTAGTGISGGGTSGTVTITNSMATAIDAKGDLIVGTGADTFDRLAAGTTGYTLVADSGETTGLKWAAAAAGGMTEIGTIDFSTATSFTSIPSTYVNLFVVVKGFGTTTANNPRIRFNSDSGTNYSRTGIYGNASTNGSESSIDVNQINLSFQAGVTTTASNAFAMNIFDYKNSTTHKVWNFNEKFNGGGTNYFGFFQGYYKDTTAISSIEFSAQSGTLEGTATLYGVK
jgi:hypothetical protein